MKCEAHTDGPYRLLGIRFSFFLGFVEGLLRAPCSFRFFAHPIFVDCALHQVHLKYSRRKHYEKQAKRSTWRTLLQPKSSKVYAFSMHSSTQASSVAPFRRRLLSPWPKSAAILNGELHHLQPLPHRLHHHLPLRTKKMPERNLMVRMLRS